MQERLDDAMADHHVERAHALKKGAKLDDAIQQYRKALALAEKLAANDPNKAWQARLQDVRKELEAALTEQRKSAEPDRQPEPRVELLAQQPNSPLDIDRKWPIGRVPPVAGLVRA